MNANTVRRHHTLRVTAVVGGVALLHIAAWPSDIEGLAGICAMIALVLSELFLLTIGLKACHRLHQLELRGQPPTLSAIVPRAMAQFIASLEDRTPRY